MRHRKSGRKLGRNSSHRKAMFRNMTESLLKHETIKTTLPKAKELRRFAEPVINLGKKHAWSNYADSLAQLDEVLSALEAVMTNASEEAQASFATVKASRAKVEGRFPSGLGALLKAVQGTEGASEHAATLATIRSTQMARQHAISQATKTVSDKEVLEKLFGDLGERFAGRNGGYTRVVKAGNREGDNAPMAYISLVFESVQSAPEEAEEAE